MKDGILLIQLVEVLSGKEMSPKPKAAKMRIQQIANANDALGFVKSVGIKSNCSAEGLTFLSLFPLLLSFSFTNALNLFPLFISLFPHFAQFVSFKF